MGKKTNGNGYRSFTAGELLDRHLVRDFRLTKSNAVVDREKKTVRVAITSDEPILHVLGGRTVAYVILDHNQESINLERVAARSSRILDTHDPKIRLGFQNNFQTDGHVGRVDWRFGAGQRAQDAFDEVDDALEHGDSPGVSAGFTIERVADKPETYRDGIPVIRALGWTLLEGSIAAIEADIRTGIGRCVDDQMNDQMRALAAKDDSEEDEDPEEEATETPDEDAAEEDEEDTGAKRSARKSAIYTRTAIMEKQTTTQIPSPLVAMQTRSDEYAKFARGFGSTDERKAELEELAREHALMGKSEDDLFRSIQDKRSKWTTKVPSAAPIVDLTDAEKRQYSISRAIMADAGLRTMSGERRETAAQCFEDEVSQEIQKRMGLSPRRAGFFMPTGLALRGASPSIDAQEEFVRLMQQIFKRTGLDTATSTHGQELVFTEAGSFIEMLRNKAMVIRLGATVLPGLQGNVAFPKQTGTGAASWVAENPTTDVTDADLALTQVTLSPKTLQSSTSYSRQLLAQGVVNVDNIVQNDLVQVNALAVDLGALHGTGANNQPTGIYAQAGVNSVAFGGAITFAKVVEMETDIAAANADVGTMAYLTTPEIRGRAKQVPELANTIALPIWRAGEMNGYRAEASNQVSKVLSGSNHGIVFGVWPELLIGEWGAMEVITDPYRLKKQGMIEVTTFLMIDIAIRYAAAFSKGTGLTNS
jgi:HK97 family phage major capsid protein